MWAIPNARYSSTSEIFGETLARSGQAISDIAPWDITAELMYQAPLKDGIIGYWRLEDRYNSKNDKLVPAQDSTTVTYDPFVTTNPAVNQLNGRIGVKLRHRVRPGAVRDQHAEHAPGVSTSRST